MEHASDQFGLEDVFTVDAFVRRYPTLFRGSTPESKKKALHWMIFKSGANGLAESGAIIGCHKATRIVAPRFRDWLASQTRAA